MTARAEQPPAGARRLPADGRARPSERARLAVEITLAYVKARRLLRRLPIEAAVTELRSGAPAGPPGADPAHTAEARRLGRAVSRTLRLLPGDTRCLVRSVVLIRLLARRGVHGTLVIGTRTRPLFLAHAWVEHAGEAVLDPGHGRFPRLAEI